MLRPADSLPFFEEAAHGGIIVAGFYALADEQPEIASERRIGIVDGLILADEAAEFGGQRAGARFLSGIGQDFISADGEGWGRGKRQTRRSKCPHPPLLRTGTFSRKREKEEREPLHAAASAPPRRFARSGAPTRRRRSSSERMPPKAMTAPPSQISSTKGFQ